MKLFGREKTAPVPERRSSPRTRVDCTAILVMPSGNADGRLFDISDTGARITTDKPPGNGVAAILEWPHGEAYCHIIWSKPGMCGVQFDRPLPASVLKATIESAPSGPRLVHSNEGDQDAAPEGDNGASGNNGPPRLFC